MAFEKLQAGMKAVNATETVALTQDKQGAQRRDRWAASMNLLQLKLSHDGRKLFTGSDSFALVGIMKLLDDMPTTATSGDEVFAESPEVPASTINGVAALNAVDKALNEDKAA